MVDDNGIKATEQEIKSSLDEIRNFVATEAFLSVLGDLFALPEHLRHEFVEAVLLDPALLKSRGVDVPDTLSIQRSHFSDNRPTLFCVSKELKENIGWKKVTFTFDNQTIGIIPPFALKPESRVVLGIAG
jgi:hypothetical protein